MAVLIYTNQRLIKDVFVRAYLSLILQQQHRCFPLTFPIRCLYFPVWMQTQMRKRSLLVSLTLATFLIG